jgi:hypothetical protein
MQACSKTLLLALTATAAISSQSVYAISVSTFGSFNQPLSTEFLFDRIYNQDDATSPAHNLPSNLNSPTNSVAYFGWGVDVVESVITQQVIQSHFWFNGAGSVAGGPAADAQLGTAFSLGSFTYTNEQTIFSGGVVGIDFQMDIKMDGLSLLPIEYRLEIDNTHNGLANSYDTARIIGTPTNMPFLLNGSQYLLTFNGFSRDGGSTFETMANLAEGGQTTAQIFATITAVPVPAAFWLMGSGLLVLSGFLRYKK